MPEFVSSLSNYPNPFNPETVISFSLDTELTGNTELAVYNLKGQQVKTFPVILSGVEGVGNTFKVTWNGTNDNNQPVPSGIYFYKLSSGNYSQTQKMMLLK